MEEIRGWSAWEEQFKPIKNTIRDNWDSYMFETYGEELEFVKNYIDDKKVWTWVTGDMSDLIVPGFAYVNRLGYYITEVPWNDDTPAVLLSVEVECECYSEDDDVMESRGGELGDPNCLLCEGYGIRTEDVE